MSHDTLLRKQLVKLLTSDEAHADLERAIRDFPAELRGKVPEGAAHSAWQILEHLRIAQWDIIDFCSNAKYETMKWPDDYWPESPEPPSNDAWDSAVANIRADIQGFSEYISDPATDLFAKIPHGDGQTILREALLIADHNAYHLGELVLLRRLLGAWE